MYVHGKSPVHNPMRKLPTRARKETRDLVLSLQPESPRTRLHIPVFRNLFLDKKTIPARITEGFFFFPVFSGGIFHRNVILEGVSGILVFHRFHRNFLQEFLRERNSCIYNGFLRIPPDSCSRQTLSGSGQQQK